MSGARNTRWGDAYPKRGLITYYLNKVNNVPLPVVSFLRFVF